MVQSSTPLLGPRDNKSRKGAQHLYLCLVSVSFTVGRLLSSGLGKLITQGTLVSSAFQAEGDFAWHLVLQRADIPLQLPPPTPPATKTVIHNDKVSLWARSDHLGDQNHPLTNGGDRPLHTLPLLNQDGDNDGQHNPLTGTAKLCAHNYIQVLSPKPSAVFPEGCRELPVRFTLELGFGICDRTW